MKHQEGKINVEGYQVWYKIVGDSDRIPYSPFTVALAQGMII
jgi:hypothetical protein